MELARRELVLAGLALCLAPAAARSAVSILPDVDIPIRLDNNELWSGVWLDKQGPFRFSISSGSTAFRVWEGLAARLRLNPMPHAVSTGGQRNSPTANMYEVGEVLIGGACALTRVPLIAWRDAMQPRTLGALPLIQDRVTVFDWSAGVMRSLHERPAERTGFQRVELIYESRGPVWTPIVVGQVNGKDVRLRVSTGSRGPVNLFAEAVERLGLWDGPGPYHDRAFEVGEARGVTRTARRGDFAIGGVRFPSPVFDLDKALNGTARKSQVDGTIGMEVLRRLSLIIDQPRRDMWIRPLANIDEPWGHDRAGFGVEDRDGGWFVSVVDAGSPAERSGLKVGDRVLTTIDSVRDARYAPAGAQVGFTVQSGDERRKVSMTLEERV